MVEILNMPASMLLSPHAGVAFIWKRRCAWVQPGRAATKLFETKSSLLFFFVFDVLKQMQLQAYKNYA